MVSYIKSIDPHVHFRGEEYKDVKPSFLELGFRDARRAGLAGVLEQPNPEPWLTEEEVVEQRLNQGNGFKEDIYHGIHVGLTNDVEQVRRALSMVDGRVGRSNSDKTFYTHSTGNMGILDPDTQRHIWWMKGVTDYRGVSIGHFEDEQKFVGDFDYINPISHSQRQTPEAELAQVERQIRNAKDGEFRGTFYVAHVSNPDTVDYIERERKKLPFGVVLEATFHHIFLNTEDYKIHGNRIKMNPPLRTPILQERLLEYVLAGRFSVIGTDHAPHPVERKNSDSPPSGIPALPFWPKGIELLIRNGMNEEDLADLTFHNTNSLFGLRLKPRIIEVEYDSTLWDAYGWNPFSRIDGGSMGLSFS